MRNIVTLKFGISGSKYDGPNSNRTFEPIRPYFRLFGYNRNLRQLQWPSPKSNMKPNLFRAWLRSNASGPITLSDVSCADRDAGMSDCNATIIGDSCRSNQSVWLNCTNSTGDSSDDVLDRWPYATNVCS